MLKVQIQWLYSDTKFFDYQMKELDDSIKVLDQQCENVKKHLERYRQPFKIMLDQVNNDLSDDDSDELAIVANMNNPKWKVMYETEQICASKVDIGLEKIAGVFGYDEQ